ncbi:MAG: hydroxyacylglutathione hydrolase [Rhizobiaceae bacterium]|nr:hydroxyacylglutathione hydrolase [Rhizobiaceae bacterium]
MAGLEFFQFPTLSDNYGVLVHDPASGATASIDAPDAGDVHKALSEKGWSLTHILVTHHHWDHVQGIGDLKSENGCRVIGPADEADKIEHIDETVSDGDTFDFCGETVSCISTPGHTLGMINFHFTDSGVVFTGDTLFALGCGRIFEGDPAMMWSSMQKLMALPAETIVYCGHEYTQTNARFALSVDPDNAKLVIRAAQIDALRADGKPTLPTTIGEELDTNPFLRASDASIRKVLGMESADDAEVFAEIRKRKDNA